MQTVKLDDGLYRTDAANGVAVLSEALPSVRSVASGIWIKAASAHEARAKMGVSHLLEHMVFKGTRRRTARDIALELEVRGGALDAYTARDHTSYQARVLEEDLPQALDVLTDLVRTPLLRQSDLDLERKVILEEISAVEDTPDDLVFELHSQAVWPDHPYGFQILGTRSTVGQLGAADLVDLHRRAYHPGNVVIAVAGRVDHETVLRQLAEYGWFDVEPGPEARPVTLAPKGAGGIQRVERDLAQTHIVMGTDTFPFTDDRRYALMLINTVFGGGMSSRLFQRVREELGLAYSVYSYQSFYQQAGLTGVYVGTHPSTAAQAVEAILTEMRLLAREGLDTETLKEAKQQLKGQLMLGLESPTARVHRLAGVVLHDEPYRSLGRVLEEIEDVTSDAVMQVAEEYFTPERHTTVWLGPN